MSTEPRETARQIAERITGTPCSGYPYCDGDLPGEAHTSLCPFKPPSLSLTDALASLTADLAQARQEIADTKEAFWKEHRCGSTCATHGDPLVCIACEQEEDARPEWASRAPAQMCDDLLAMPPLMGWQCPACGRGNAPWLPTCQCIDTGTTS